MGTVSLGRVTDSVNDAAPAGGNVIIMYLVELRKIQSTREQQGKRTPDEAGV
jgi:hypothetical protein